jgi:hypothetical protein
MDSDRARCGGWPYVLVAVGLLGCLVERHAAAVQPTTPLRQAPPAACGVRDVRSPHFLVHTDLSRDEANRLVARLETMLRLISTYWGRPLESVIECYVVRNLDKFPRDGMDLIGIRAIRTVGGMVVMRTATDGTRYLAKSIVYADARPEVVQHEVVHAYCHHAFGRIGPVWYSEGMAEMGHYWTDGDRAVRADPREIKYLREHPPKSLAETLSAHHASGDSWQNYASRWALCHFLSHAPNYSPQFSSLGLGLLTGQDVSFEQTFGARARELSFEYLFFLEHLAPGCRVDLTAWEWNKEFAALRSGRMMTSAIAAGRGWQPSGLTVRSGVPYEYTATGTCRIAGGPRKVDANGDHRGRGRLVGVLYDNYQLGTEFELGTEGSLQLPAGGNLYLRCRNAWNELAADSGRLSVKLKLQGRSLPE